MHVSSASHVPSVKAFRGALFPHLRIFLYKFRDVRRLKLFTATANDGYRFVQASGPTAGAQKRDLHLTSSTQQQNQPLCSSPDGWKDSRQRTVRMSSCETFASQSTNSWGSCTGALWRVHDRNSLRPNDCGMPPVSFSKGQPYLQRYFALNTTEHD